MNMDMDIDIVIESINNSNKDETESESAQNQILTMGSPKIQRTTIDKLELKNKDKPVEIAMNAYKKAVKQRKEIEFYKRLKSKNFRDGIRDGVGKIKIDSTLSNKPNKKR